ncbi:peptide/nickel transport system substrate-binding protein [Inquilinus ginsengisoli]|uniref:Peptide/nickel transport system substrate-binding protein n=1 Tax=Inquilinus ginsengisoli TaxID=363840 RepID=A0ABU1JZC9_9PROT|nr:ABC transporter substrate-binding protein [Inquilinus ginsengisoli]MDR6292879.1 peptide/nickel transport system substrate-binding protein [Inquilinus ginsengisoli]
MTKLRPWIGVLALLLVPGMAHAEAPAPRQTPLLSIALNADIRSSNPGVQRDFNSDVVLQHVVEGLVAPREDLTVAPLLASSIDVSPDGTAYTFHLRDGVGFHDGKPLTSAEVAWSWKRYLDPATQWQCLDRFDGRNGPKVVAVETPDPRTAVFRLDRRSAMFLVNMASIQCDAVILSPSSVGPDGAWIRPVGTGPYVFGDWQKNRYLELTRFPGYSPLPGSRDGMVGGRQALAEQLRFVVIPDRSVMNAALQAGQVDIINDVGPTEMDAMKAMGAQVTVTPTLSWAVLLLQTRDPLLSDVRVRQALAQAIDGKQVAEAASFGLATPNPSAVAVASAYHTQAEAAWPAFDLVAAAKLLQEAGHAGATLRIQTNNRPTGQYEAALMIQGLLAGAGIDARLDTLDWATQLQNYREGKFQASVFTFSGRADPALAYDSIVGSKDDDPTSQWEDPQAIAWLDEAKTVEDKAARQAVFDRLHARMAEQVPVIGLFNPVQVTAAGPKVRGYADWAPGTARLWGVWKAE